MVRGELEQSFDHVVDFETPTWHKVNVIKGQTTSHIHDVMIMHEIYTYNIPKYSKVKGQTQSPVVTVSIVTRLQSRVKRTRRSDEPNQDAQILQSYCNNYCKLYNNIIIH